MLTPQRLAMDREREVLGHDVISIDNLYTRALQRAHERLELIVPVQVGAVQQAARVHAKMDATGFVDVSRPFWCSR